MLTPLTLNFSMALLSGYIFVTMINLIFAGMANTVFKYIFSTLAGAGAVIWFGIAAAEIVHLIKDM